MAPRKPLVDLSEAEWAERLVRVLWLCGGDATKRTLLTRADWLRSGGCRWHAGMNSTRALDRLVADGRVAVVAPRTKGCHLSFGWRKTHLVVKEER